MIPAVRHSRFGSVSLAMLSLWLGAALSFASAAPPVAASGLAAGPLLAAQTLPTLADRISKGVNKGTTGFVTTTVIAA